MAHFGIIQYIREDLELKFLAVGRNPFHRDLRFFVLVNTIDAFMAHSFRLYLAMTVVVFKARGAEDDGDSS